MTNPFERWSSAFLDARDALYPRTTEHLDINNPFGNLTRINPRDTCNALAQDASPAAIADMIAALRIIAGPLPDDIDGADLPLVQSLRETARITLRKHNLD